MNIKIFNACKALGLLLPGITLILLLTVSSCQKKEIAPEFSKNDIIRVNDLLKGEIISGIISDVQEDTDGLAIVFGNEEEIIFLQNIPSKTIASIGTIQNAKLIYSKFGVVVQDMNTNKTWLYPNNDTESREKFELVKPYLPENCILSEVAGTIKINSPFLFLFSGVLSDK